MNVVTVDINGIQYSFKGEENEEYLYRVANYVDKKMRETIEKKQELSVSSAAVLTAVNAADEMCKALKANEELNEQLKHMQEYDCELQNKIKDSNSNNNEEEIIKLSKENKELKLQLQSYKTKIIDMQNKLIENQINLAKIKKMNNFKNPPLKKDL